MSAVHPLRTLDGPRLPLRVEQPSSGIPARMPDEDQLYVETPPQRVSVTVSPDAIAARLAQLPTRKEMWRPLLLAVTTAAGLVQCLAWIFR
jgi:hypothetical protein